MVIIHDWCVIYKTLNKTLSVPKDTGQHLLKIKHGQKLSTGRVIYSVDNSCLGTKPSLEY
jgi:hypothetical protein